MRKNVVCVLLFCALLLTFTSCFNPNKKDETFYFAKLTEQKQVDLDHELYNAVWVTAEHPFSYEDVINDYSQEFLKKHSCLECEYQETDIQSVAQAVAHYETMDPDGMFSLGYVVGEVNYDPEYDVWCIWICLEQRIAEFQAKKPVASWCIFFRGNGQFLFRIE